MAATAPETPVEEAESIEQSVLESILQAAKDRWLAALEDDAGAASILESVEITTADLPDLALGEATGSLITVDVDAAGHGWFVDATPMDDEEFNPVGGSDELKARPNGEADGKIDLLTVVMHEMGHLLGYADVHPLVADGDLMSATLDVGTRRDPLATVFGEESQPPPADPPSPPPEEEPPEDQPPPGKDKTK